MTTADNEYPKASNATLIGSTLTYVAGLFLLFAFAGPYWLESYPEMNSEFKHMGLWEYCFNRFRFPSYQFDKLFHGCNYIFSQEYHVIREWLVPGWLMVVQAFVTLAFILSLVAQSVLACVVVRWPLRTVLRYEWICVATAFICVALSSFLLFLAVAVFGGNCYRRDWLLYPSFNVLSWSYAFAVIAFMIFGLCRTHDGPQLNSILRLTSQCLFSVLLQSPASQRTYVNPRSKHRTLPSPRHNVTTYAIHTLIFMPLQMKRH